MTDIVCAPPTTARAEKNAAIARLGHRDNLEHRLENLGRVSDSKDNLYSRTVYGGIPGHILVACGSAESHLAVWSMASGTVRRFGRPGASLRFSVRHETVT
jgi:hypothetical protein